MTDAREERAGDGEGVESTPPLPKVDLPPINREPADRSTAGYVASTPGLNLDGDESAAEPGAEPAAAAPAVKTAVDEAAERTAARARQGRIGALVAGVVGAAAVVVCVILMAMNGAFG